MDKIDIFEYTNYRLFLRDLYQYNKSLNKKFSQRFIIKEVAATSSGWFSDILAGRTNLSSTYRIKLETLFGLNGKEREYFTHLVEYDQAGSLEEKEMHFKKIISSQTPNTKVIGQDKFEYFSTWYIPVIRELLFFYEFSGDYKALAKKLNPPITIAESKKAITVLLSLDFIKKDEKGIYRPCEPLVKKNDSYGSVYWALYMKMALKYAEKGIYSFGKDERDFSALSMGLSEEGLTKAREAIANLRKELLTISEEDDKRDKVFQCNIQLFPFTKNDDT